MKLITPKNEYRLTPAENFRDRLPKRFAYAITVDGLTVPVTTNKGFAGEAAAIEYPWFLIDGRAYYATGTPGEKASEEFAAFTIEEGTAARPNPKRETTRTEREAARIAAFRVTFAARTIATK